MNLSLFGAACSVYIFVPFMLLYNKPFSIICNLKTFFFDSIKEKDVLLFQK